MADTPPPRIPAPSALDGYRRLARARRAMPAGIAHAHAVHVDAAEVGRGRDRSTRLRRIVGRVRLAGFAAALAIIVGTSVTMAIAGPDGDATDRAVPSEPAGDTTATSQSERSSTKPASGRSAADTPSSSRAGGSSRTAAATTPVAALGTTPTRASASQGVSTPTPTPTSIAPLQASSRSLPYTGAAGVMLTLLLGAGMLLAGMLVQIAGEPLPAAARRRRAPRASCAQS